MVKEEIVQRIYNLVGKSPYVRKREFEKGAIIANYISNHHYVYFLMNGEANLVRRHYGGDNQLVSKFERYDCFGDIFHDVTINNEMVVIATKRCSVLYFDYDDVVKEYPELARYVFEMTVENIKNMNEHISVLNQKTTRDKLLMYFRSLSRQRMSRSFSIPFSYTELASYLNVDRSAMMREISFLEEDGIINKEKHFIILNS